MFVPWWMLQIVVQSCGSIRSIESVCYTRCSCSQWEPPDNDTYFKRCHWQLSPFFCFAPVSLSVSQKRVTCRPSKWGTLFCGWTKGSDPTVQMLVVEELPGWCHVQIGSAFWRLLGTHFDCHNVCKFEIYRAQMRFDTWKANRCPLCSRIRMIFETVLGVCSSQRSERLKRLMNHYQEPWCQM